MSKELIQKLSNLKAQRSYLLRQIDIYYFDKKKRHINFVQLKKIDKDIEKTKFKLNLEKELKYAKNNNTNDTSFKKE